VLVANAGRGYALYLGATTPGPTAAMGRTAYADGSLFQTTSNVQRPGSRRMQWRSAPLQNRILVPIGVVLV